MMIKLKKILQRTIKLPMEVESKPMKKPVVALLSCLSQLYPSGLFAPQVASECLSYAHWTFLQTGETILLPRLPFRALNASFVNHSHNFVHF